LRGILCSPQLSRRRGYLPDGSDKRCESNLLSSDARRSIGSFLLLAVPFRFLFPAFELLCLVKNLLLLLGNSFLLLVVQFASARGDQVEEAVLVKSFNVLLLDFGNLGGACVVAENDV
jgi:hypothetical protein